MSAKLSIGFLGARGEIRRVKSLFAFAAVHCLIGFTPAQVAVPPGPQIVTAARQQIGVTKEYDPAYVALAYPGGDVPRHTGVCSDVVVRALRKVGIDLQKEVHEDMRQDFQAYPQKWGLRGPDKNIDHRRVPNLMRYFERHHLELSEKLKMPETYRPGDIVAWDLGRGILHIGIVSDRVAGRTPLIFHNIGSGTREEDILFQYRVIGHYVLKAVTQPNSGTRPATRSETNRTSPASVSRP